MIGGRAPKANAPMVVLGPGTGFGVAALHVRGEKGGVVVRSEGGHATLPRGSLREDAIIAKLRQQFGHVSAERALSGSGLENLYHSIAWLQIADCARRRCGRSCTGRSRGRFATSRDALDTFARCLARSPAIWRSPSVRRAGSTLPAASSHIYAIFCRNQRSSLPVSR